MFSYGPMMPGDRRRMAAEGAATNARSSPSQRPGSSRYPQALPCPDASKVFAQGKVVMGTVDIEDPQELQKWLLVARPVSRKEAEKRGGCIRYTPAASEEDNADGSPAAPQYFCITDPDDVVYGRAAYLSGPEETTKKTRSWLFGSRRCRGPQRA